MRDRIKKTDYYRKLDRLLGNDGGIEQQIESIETQLIHALVSEAKTECDLEKTLEKEAEEKITRNLRSQY